MATTQAFTRDMMVAVLAGTHPTASVVQDTSESQTIFATRHTLIWRDMYGDLWRCHYTLDSTTAQDYSPWENQTLVESTRVRPQVVEVLTYVNVVGRPTVSAAPSVRTAEDARRKPIPGDTWTGATMSSTWTVVAVADWDPARTAALLVADETPGFVFFAPQNADEIDVSVLPSGQWEVWNRETGWFDRIGRGLESCVEACLDALDDLGAL